MVEIKNIVSHLYKDDISQCLVSFDIKHNGAFMPDCQSGIEICMSQSTMHSMDKFMTTDYNPFTKYVLEDTKNQIKRLYNNYVESKGNPSLKYEAFEKLVHNLPLGFELWATCTASYEQLKTMVIQRFNHPQKEDWKNFIESCYKLPEFRELTGLAGKEWDLENWR